MSLPCNYYDIPYCRYWSHHRHRTIGHSLIWEAATTTIKLVDRSELQIDCNCSRFLCFIDCMCCTFTSIWTALIYYLIQQRRLSLNFYFNCWKNQNLGGYHIVFINKYEERQSENNKAEAAIVCTSNSNLKKSEDLLLLLQRLQYIPYPQSSPSFLLSRLHYHLLLRYHWMAVAGVSVHILTSVRPPSWVVVLVDAGVLYPVSYSGSCN